MNACTHCGRTKASATGMCGHCCRFPLLESVPLTAKARDEDPFASAADATRDDCETRPRTWGVPEPPEVRGAEWVAKKTKARRKRVDLNPQQRKWFEANGWTYVRVEKPNAFGAVTVDLWASDYLAAKPGEGLMLVQVTDSTHAAARLRKARAVPELAVWLQAGGCFEVHSWKQSGGPGTRWEMERRPITAAAFDAKEA